MPSAANVKIDKHISTENATVESSSTSSSASNNNSTPLRQAITIIEHKIRNLEKRKVGFGFLKRCRHHYGFMTRGCYIKSF